MPQCPHKGDLERFRREVIGNPNNARNGNVQSRQQQQQTQAVSDTVNAIPGRGNVAVDLEEDDDSDSFEFGMATTADFD